MNKLKILWADDEIEYLKPHILFLESKGYHTTTVNNGLDAIDMVKSTYFDIVFLDENMPGLSGLETLAEIKKIKDQLPVIMITKNEEEHLMEDAIGSKIADYLIKPVNPHQILLAIKKITDNRRILTEQVTQRYQREFGKISMALMENPNWQGFVDLFKTLTYWELEMDETEETGMEEVLKSQKEEANRSFSKFIEKNYFDFMANPEKQDFYLSQNVMRKAIFPAKTGDKPMVLLVIDNLRLDQWKTIQKEINNYYITEKEEMYMSILPTTTQYARNALFAGMTPFEISTNYPEKWVADDEDGGRNTHEEALFESLLMRERIQDKHKYIKVTSLKSAHDMLDQLPNCLHVDLSVIVYNFIDTLSHARTDSKVMRELAEDEKAYRALTKSWFGNSPLLEAIKFFANHKIKMMITTDHGSVRVNKPIVIKGEKEITTNLRYKTGRRLNFNPKEVFSIPKPKEAGLPESYLTSAYIFSKPGDFFVYSNNLNHYAKYYNDTFQHGGISMEEMIVPLITLQPK